MAKSRNDILFRFLGDTKSLDKASGKAKSGFKDASRSGGVFQGALGGITRAAGALGIALGGREVLQWAGDAVQMAVAAEEVDSKFDAVFGSAEKFNDELSALGDMGGVTDTKMRDLAATFGNLASSSGMPDEAVKDLTISVATLALDMASFNDADPAEVFRTLNTATLTAERDGLKKFGISVSENEVKQRALTLAVADGRDEITKADRALASYELISEAAGQANGDLERTQDSLANQQRQLTADMEEFKEELGRELLPAYAKLIGVTRDAAPLIKALAGKIADLAIDSADAATDMFNLAEAVNDYIGISDVAIGDTNLLSTGIGFLTENIVGATYGFGKMITLGFIDSVKEVNEEFSAADESLIRLNDDMATSAVRYDQFETSTDEVTVALKAAGLSMGELQKAAGVDLGVIDPKLEGSVRSLHTAATNAFNALSLLQQVELSATGGSALGGGVTLHGPKIADKVTQSQYNADLEQLNGMVP